MIKEALQFIADRQPAMRFETENGTEVLLDPSGKIHDLTAITAKYEWAPLRAQGTAAFTDPESFISYVNHFATVPCATVAGESLEITRAVSRKHPALQMAGNHSDAKLNFTAIFNYHQPPHSPVLANLAPGEYLPAVVIDQNITPGWCDFRATLDLAKHLEWNTLAFEGSKANVSR